MLYFSYRTTIQFVITVYFMDGCRLYIPAFKSVQKLLFSGKRRKWKKRYSMCFREIYSHIKSREFPRVQRTNSMQLQ